MPCSECNFFQPVTAPVCLPRRQRLGECRRHPPKNVGTPLHRENQTHAVFPIVSEDDWCGEFVEWPAPLGERATDKVNTAIDAAAHDDATGGPVAARTGQCQPLPERSPGRRD